jgi:hypothetical protein
MITNFPLPNASSFRVKQMSIVTKGGVVDITNLFLELNIHDSLFLPTISGSVVIREAVGLSGKLAFDGSEVIAIHIEKSKGSDIAAFKKAFRIYKQSARTNINGASESYIIHFCSDEFLFSFQQRVNQSYESTYSDVAGKILSNYLKVVPSDVGIIDSSFGLKKIVVPNLTPLEAIEWCAKRAVDIKNSPNFVFYRNSTGFNFESLSNLLVRDTVLDIRFEAKNQNKTDLEELSAARHFEPIVQNDSISAIVDGVNAGTFVGFDPMTRNFGAKSLNFSDQYEKMEHANKGAKLTEVVNRDGTSTLTTFDSRKVVSLFGSTRKDSAYIKANDPTSISKVENQQDYIFQRKALLSNLTNSRIKLVMPGNFHLTSGFNINLAAPGFEKQRKGAEKDLSVDGKYLIIASRHIITYNKHETVIEVARDSTNDKSTYVSSPDQNRMLQGFTI